MAGKLIIAIVVLLALAAGGLALYGSQVSPAQRSFEQVLPNDRFPS